MHAKSMSAVNSVQSQKAYRKWVHLVRKEHPPVDMKEYLQQWEVFFDHYATQVEHWRRRNAGYHNTIASVASFHIPSGARVLEVGSGNGDLLAALKPSYGFGVDISGEMVRLAQQ